MKDPKEKIIEMFDGYFDAIEKEYDLSDDRKRALKDKIIEDIVEIEN